MGKRFFLLLSIVAVVAIILVVRSERGDAAIKADAPPLSQQAVGAIARRLNDAFALQPDSVTPSPLAGVAEVRYGTRVMYVSNDGRYLLSGELYDLASLENLTERRVAVSRAEIIDQLPESSMIIYRADDEKHVLTVFTDIDCVYCRKLHREMAALNELGITVRYLAYPRAGAGSSSYDKAVSVWCADDRNRAMDQAKGNGMIVPADCDAPVLQHMQLAQQLGVNSTPSLLLADGRLQPGYAPARQLLSLLEDSSHR